MKSEQRIAWEKSVREMEEDKAEHALKGLPPLYMVLSEIGPDLDVGNGSTDEDEIESLDELDEYCDRAMRDWMNEEDLLQCRAAVGDEVTIDVIFNVFDMNAWDPTDIVDFREGSIVFRCVSEPPGNLDAPKIRAAYQWLRNESRNYKKSR